MPLGADKNGEREGGRGVLTERTMGVAYLIDLRYEFIDVTVGDVE